jgi:myo-inositol-1(or 4)-monophosphatase
MNPIVNIALNAARKAGNVMLRSIERLDTINSTQKGLHDFVSDVDKKAEQEIIYTIQKAHPNHQILAEETGLHPGESDCVWIIDPLDGTHNYVRGLPHFSVSIAFQFKGKIEHGLIFDPIRHEIFSASRGQGARLNDRRLRVSPTTVLDHALIGTGFPVRYPNDLLSYLPIFQRIMPKIGNIRCSGSAALDLAYVAAGRLDAFLELKMKPWDTAAGSLLVKEAGGLVADWQGEEKFLENGAIIATTPKLLSLLLKLIAASKEQ